MRKLDRNAYFKEVHGDREHNIHYEQNGFHYDAMGVLVEEILTDSDKARLARLEKQAAAKKAADAAYREAMGDDHQGEGSGAGEEEGGDAAQKEGDLDLVAWLKGEQKYQFFEVQAAVKSRFSQVCNSKKDVIEYLVNEKRLVSADQVAI